MLLNYKSRELYTWCIIAQSGPLTCHSPDSKVHGANMGPTWVLSAPDGPHIGPMNPAIWEVYADAKRWHTDTVEFV